MTELESPLFIPPDDEGIIEEEVTTAQLLQSPPRKRSRNLLEIEEPSMKNTPHQPLEIVRDKDYYLSDGSCIILVENTLFNVSSFSDHLSVAQSHAVSQVHRTTLSKDSSSFSSMFSLPRGDKTVEGLSDDNPVILVGDTVSQFRNFLWALYAL